MTADADPAAVLAAMRARDTARAARWRKSHPEAVAQYAASHRAAKRRLVELHQAEYDGYVAAIMETGPPSRDTARNRAHRKLREAHPDEWQEILAVMT